MMASYLLSLLLISSGLAIEPKVSRADYNIFSDQDEAVLGRNYAAVTDRELPLIQNRSLIDYVQQILNRLGTQSQRPMLKYQARIVDSPQINAFALPGGYIYTYRGLLDMA